MFSFQIERIFPDQIHLLEETQTRRTRRTLPVPPYHDQSLNEPSIWEPTQNPLSLEAFALVKKLKIAHLKPTCPKRQNITKAERNAIKELSNNKEIVIKPADKGGATVILNTTDYITEGLRQLSDPHFYRDMGEKDLTEYHNNNVKRKVLQMSITCEIHL